MARYLLLLVGLSMIFAMLGTALALKYNRIKADTHRVVLLLCAAALIATSISSLWASLDNSRARERFDTQLAGVRVHIADMQRRTDANAAAMRHAGEGPQANSPAERQRVLDLVKEARALEAEGRRLRSEIDNIRNELDEALQRKERRAFWRALILAVALLPLAALLYRHHGARQRAIEERNAALIALGIDPKVPSDRVKELVRSGRKARAIKLYLQETGVSLAEAKQAVEKLNRA
jgi:hypothetical protein